MENRRQTGTSADRPFNREKTYKKPENRNYAPRVFQPREGGYQPREDRFAPRDASAAARPARDSRDSHDNRFQPRDNRQPGRDNRFQPRDQRPAAREGGFQPRENNFQPRGGERFAPRGAGGYEPRRDDRFQKSPNGYDPRKRFAPRPKAKESWKDLPPPKVYSEMQITDGKHRGKFFETTASPKVRPTTRRLREAMFKMIFRRVRAGRFLDLCAGSGAVGLEAVSRGALLSTFVERSAKMCHFIRKNMEKMGIKEGHGEIFEIEILPFLKQMQKRRRQWDVVFLDPPYDANYDEILDFLGRGVCIKPRGALVIEHHAEMFFPEQIGHLKRWRVVVEGESALSFYERK